MDLRTKEAIRYLGFGKHPVDDKTMQLIKESFDELEKLAEKKFVYEIFELSAIGGGVQIGQLNIHSKSLYKNLEPCKQVVLFGATLGTSVDRQLRKYEILNIAKAVVWQACAAAFLEEFCDEMQEKILKELGPNYTMRPRFSPGYGDFSITYQDDILRMLNATKHVGITLTEAKMMSPSKSVTALIGICDTKE